jgi:ribosomal protein S18 acetylase RimI-like enzyme
MSDRPSVRPAEPEDADRLRGIAESTMTADYALSPGEIETVLETEFDPEARRERLAEEGDEPTTFVAVVEDDADGETVVAGFAEVDTDADDGTESGAVRWLHVDPERRGLGVGTALFEHARNEFDGGVRALALADNTASGAFFERFDYGRVEERSVELGDVEVVEHVYAEGAQADDGNGSGSESESGSGSGDDGAGETEVQGRDAVGGLDEKVGDEEADGIAAADDAPDLPDTVSPGDRETAYVGTDPFQGTEGGFVQTYVDPDRTEPHGYYCLNCESTDVTMDSMERVRCESCGNERKPDDDYDGSYL